MEEGMNGETEEVTERGMERRRYEEINKINVSRKGIEKMFENSKFCLFTNKIFCFSQVMLPRVNHLKNSSPG